MIRIGVVLVLVGLCIGIVRTEQFVSGQKEIVFDDTVLEGVVVSDVEVQSERITFVFKTHDTQVLVYADKYPEVRYGDRIVVRGMPQAPKPFETDTGRVFAYDKYLATKGISHSVFYPEVEVVGHGEGNVFVRAVLSFKHVLADTIARYVRAPDSSLVQGVVFGMDAGLGEDLEDAFRTVGLIHIVVLSGYNVTIVAEWMMRMLGFLSKRARAFCGIGAIIAFVVMTGGGATIVRAGIMAMLVIIARLYGRQGEMNHFLVLAGIGMLLWNPYTLMYDASFQLSFLATFGLLNISPRIEKYATWLPEKFGLREAFVASISTQIAVLPLLMYLIGEVSLVSPLVNVLGLIAIPPMMLFGFITGVCGAVFAPLGSLCGLITMLFTRYVLILVEFFAGLPFAKVGVPSISLWLVCGAYTVILYTLYITKKRGTLYRGD